jgi:purine-binding chemotaxis protein CheW
VKGTAHRSQPEAGPTLSGENEPVRWVVFALGEGRYALPLAAVERIVRAVQITSLPLAPPVVLGAINVEGRILPVFSLRHRLHLPERPVDPSDQFLIARTAQRSVALVIDAAQGLVELPTAAIVDVQRVEPGLEHIRGILPLEDGMVLIHDLEQFLSREEGRALDEALKGAQHAG